MRRLTMSALGLLLLGGCVVHERALFPTDLPGKEWQSFQAAGYSRPACGVIYRRSDKVTNGMALGGIDTGCLDLETSGLLGYCTLFNSHIPRRGPLNLPILGMSVGGQTWVFCDPKQTKQGVGAYQGGEDGKPIPRVWDDLKLDGVRTPREIHYWGHYPIADLEFDTDAPVSVGLRAWNPFLPGDVRGSMLPGIVFEVHLRNHSASPQKGTLAFSFPGPTQQEAGTKRFVRRDLRGNCPGVIVQGDLACYALAAIDQKDVRSGGELGGEGSNWAKMAAAFPKAQDDQAGSCVAVDFSLPAGRSSVVRFVLTWSAPTWCGTGQNGAPVPTGYSGQPRTFHHMYDKYYPDAEKTLALLAKDHVRYLQRVLAWQQVVYTEEKLPLWLRDSLINVLYMITEDGLWAQAKAPMPDWVRQEDGIFGMSECPRECPQIECIPCSFYGSLPIVYFFPELELSTLRGYKGYQYEDGAPPWVFGGCTGKTPYFDFAYPTRGYQFTTNGISLAALVNEFLLCHDTPDRKYLKEFYPMMKKNMVYTVGLRSTPSYSIGEKIISMPDGNEGTEWFEAPEPGWCGMTAHVAGLHLAQLRIVERMAKDMGDAAFAEQCAQWIHEAARAMEQFLWVGSYYLNYLEPDTSRKSDLVFGYQLDGEWITDHHGLPSGLPPDRVQTVLGTIQRCNIAVTKFGAVNYTNADGTPAQVKGYGTYSYFPPEALMLAMTYMYNGHPSFGLELAHKVWHNLICSYGYTWDMPNIMRGDQDSGERTYGSDYYQDMMLWSMPAAIDNAPVNAPAKPGGLVDRVIRAARG